MKRKSLLTILLTLVLCFTMALTACKDDNDGPFANGVPKSPEQVNEMVRNMPTSSSESEIASAISEVFGADIALPEGTYSAQTYTYNGMSTYAVTVSDANTSAAEYYDSIKSEMLAEGYTAEESELAFYKVVGAVMYSIAVESEGHDIMVYMGTSTLTSDPSDPGNPGNPFDSGTPSIPGTPSTPSTPAVLPSGNLNAFPVAEINSMFAVLGVTIPNYTAGSSYSIDSLSNDLSTGKLSITVTCYGTTREEIDAYAQALKDAGFQSAGYLIYMHNVSYYSNLVVQRTTNEKNKTHTLTFWVQYDAPSYTLPENLKVTYTFDNYYSYTAIKIGENYYLRTERNLSGEISLGSQLYYKKNGSAWDLWENYGNGWEKDAYGTTEYIDFVEQEIFDFITEEADIDEDAVQGEDTTLLGRTVNVYEYDTGYGYVFRYYKDVQTGLILRCETASMGYTSEEAVTSFDTSVTSFGDVELPQ